jgi:hypothetical protein
VVGSAWIPWLRPIMTVSRCATAFASTVFSSSTSAARSTAPASRICMAKAVSRRSLLVMPWWTNRLAGPMCSARLVRKAITSCWTVASISSTRAVSKRAFSRISRAASAGISPRAARTSQTTTSTSCQRSKRAWSLQMAVISLVA